MFTEIILENLPPSLLSLAACSNSETITTQVKERSSFILQRHANFSLCVFYLHSSKPALLNALGRIKVEVCFEGIQRG